MHRRNSNFIKQIKFSFLFRIGSMLFSFLVIKYMIMYLGIEEYGVWSVVLSFITWILFFDLGISNGVKNKVSESLAHNNINIAVEYISTGYIVIAFFSFILFILFYFISGFLNWQIIFNTTVLSNTTFISMLRYIFFFILLNFSLSIITAVFSATQKASLIVFNQFLNNLFSLIVVLLLLKFTTSNLTYLAISYGSVLVSSNLIMSFWFYYTSSYLSPKLSLFDNKKVKVIFSLGLKFFLLQVTLFFILTTDKIIITQLLGANYVAKYDILYKYFSSIMIIHSIVNTPLWSMYTEAYIKNDYEWIVQMLLKMIKMMFIYMFILIVMIIIATPVINIWLDNDKFIFSISNYIYISIMLLFLIWHSIFAYFTNGIEKTNIQLITTVIGALINIPLSILFVKYYNMGMNGVILATILSLSIFGFFAPIQAVKEIQKMKFKSIEI